MNLEEETRCGYTISAKMKRVWAIQLDLLDELLRVCNKYSLKIWVDGGTLLGTVRHQGYIPWDDDIDLIMLRKDYDRLIKVAGKEFRSPYFFQCAYTENVPYPRGHAQLRKDGTTAILPGDINRSYHQGIFIDIFVLDTLPSNEKIKNYKLKRIALYRNLLSAYYQQGIWRPSIKATLHRLLNLLYCKTHHFVSTYRKFEQSLNMKSKENSEWLCNLGLLNDRIQIESKKMRAEWYDNTLYLPFENLIVPVPKEYDKVLTQLYGDYMTPKQAPSYHGGFMTLDAGKGYQESLEQLRYKNYD